MQVISVVRQTIEGDYDEWREKLAQGLIFSGEFYTVFMIQKLFISNGFALLQIGSILKNRLDFVIADTDIDRQLAFKAGPAPIGFNIAVLLTSFLLVMSFSITFPVLPAFGFLYFCLSVRDI